MLDIEHWNLKYYFGMVFSEVKNSNLSNNFFSFDYLKKAYEWTPTTSPDQFSILSFSENYKLFCNGNLERGALFEFFKYFLDTYFFPTTSPTVCDDDFFDIQNSYICVAFSHTNKTLLEIEIISETELSKELFSLKDFGAAIANLCFDRCGYLFNQANPFPLLWDKKGTSQNFCYSLPEVLYNQQLHIHPSIDGESHYGGTIQMGPNGRTSFTPFIGHAQLENDLLSRYLKIDSTLIKKDIISCIKGYHKQERTKQLQKSVLHRHQKAL